MVLCKTVAALGLLLILLSVGVQAIYVNSPGTVIVQQAQKEAIVTIRNDSSIEQDYSAHFSAPFSSSLSPSFGSIKAGESIQITISIAPQKALERSAYYGTLEVQMGGEKSTRGIKIMFKEKESAPQEEPEGKGQDAQPTLSDYTTGFFSFGTGLFAFGTGLLTPENALNAALFLVAAILLIAFIARFVKRLEASK